ncbi:MAG: hypothetical protein Q8S19_05065 [Bacillota bacterium]|nr:hypothetical protein [Bacillota bacterium]
MKTLEDELNDVCAQALAKWSAPGQVDCLLEEMAELQKELIKNRRGRDNVEAIAEEVADVEIMLHQLKLMFGVQAQVDAYKLQKLERLKTRLYPS